MILHRRIFSAALATAAVLAGGLLPVSEAQAQPVTARIAVIYKEGQPTVVMWNRFRDLIRERTGGQVELQIFPGGQLGGEREVADGMRLGSIQGADSTLAALSSWVPEGQVFDLLFVFRDLAHVEAVTNGAIGERYKPLYRAQGFELLSYITYGARNVVSREPILTPADARGKKIRVLQSPLHIAIWKTLGANPTAIPITETYGALSTGVVDFMDMTKDGFEALKLFEVAPHFVETGHIWSLGGIVFSQRFWQRLSPEQKRIFQTTANEMSGYFNRIQQAEIGKALERTIAKGAKVSQVNQGPWRDAMRPVWEAEASKFGGMENIMSIVNTR
ncbi:MAG: TRAP transporter substrate-binding protein [Rhodoferax sp.]|nr:TRAP transporter substrate-binding protein [Rhodoferax sp.]